MKKGLFRILIITTVIVVAIYFYGKKKEKVSKNNKQNKCTCSDGLTEEKNEIITSILQKHNGFINELANGFNVAPNDVDLSWLYTKNVAELEGLLAMNYNEFKQMVISDIQYHKN